jgi:cytochrome c oxidase cbb3-type subunit I/II
MYISGFTQGLMWKQFNPDGTLLWKNWLDTVTAIIPYFKMRFLGGIFYISGAILMVVNVIKTVKAGSFQKEVPAEAPALANIGTARKEGEGIHFGWKELLPCLLY